MRVKNSRTKVVWRIKKMLILILVRISTRDNKKMDRMREVKRIILMKPNRWI